MSREKGNYYGHGDISTITVKTPDNIGANVNTQPARYRELASFKLTQ